MPTWRAARSRSPRRSRRGPGDVPDRSSPDRVGAAASAGGVVRGRGFPPVFRSFPQSDRPAARSVRDLCRSRATLWRQRTRAVLPAQRVQPSNSRRSASMRSSRPISIRRAPRAPWKTIWEPARFGSELSGLIADRPPSGLLPLDVAGGGPRSRRPASSRRSSFERQVQRGDIVVSLGAGWAVPHYMKHIVDAKRRYGIRFSMLIYDLIPIENESFVEQRHVVQFRNWLREAMPVADVVLTISQHSRDALIKPGGGRADGRCRRSRSWSWARA